MMGFAGCDSTKSRWAAEERLLAGAVWREQPIERGSARTRGVAPEESAQRGTSGAANGGGGRRLPRSKA